MNNYNQFLIEEAKKYKNFSDFIVNISELPTDILRNEKNLSVKLEKGVYNKNRTRNNLIGYGKDTPLGEFDDFVKDIKENGIKTPIRVRINDDGLIIIADGSHRLLASSEIGLQKVPVELIGKVNRSLLFKQIYNQAHNKEMKIKSFRSFKF